MAEHDNTVPDQKTGAIKTTITKEIDVGNKRQTTRYRVTTTRVDLATGRKSFNFRTRSTRPASK